MNSQNHTNFITRLSSTSNVQILIYTQIHVYSLTCQNKTLIPHNANRSTKNNMWMGTHNIGIFKFRFYMHLEPSTPSHLYNYNTCSHKYTFQTAITHINIQTVMNLGIWHLSHNFSNNSCTHFTFLPKLTPISVCI